MKLGIVYHMPFWQAADGTLREVEGSSRGLGYQPLNGIRSLILRQLSEFGDRHGCAGTFLDDLDGMAVVAAIEGTTAVTRQPSRAVRPRADALPRLFPFVRCRRRPQAP